MSETTYLDRLGTISAANDSNLVIAYWVCMFYAARETVATPNGWNYFALGCWFIMFALFLAVRMRGHKLSKMTSEK